LLNLGISKLTDLVDILLTKANINEVLHSLIIDGILTESAVY
jgi:hypothetical protein